MAMKKVLLTLALGITGISYGQTFKELTLKGHGWTSIYKNDGIQRPEDTTIRKITLNLNQISSIHELKDGYSTSETYNKSLSKHELIYTSIGNTYIVMNNNVRYIVIETIKEISK
jgi:hypothetical protein